MKRICMFAAAAMLTLSTSAAHALPVLTTGPLRIGANAATGDDLVCMAVNIGKKTIEVRITSELDNVVVGPNLFLAPGETATNFNTNSDPASRNGLCRFEVKGGKKNVRASACALDQNNNCRAAVDAS